MVKTLKRGNKIEKLNKTDDIAKFYDAQKLI